MPPNCAWWISRCCRRIATRGSELFCCGSFARRRTNRCACPFCSTTAPCAGTRGSAPSKPANWVFTTNSNGGRPLTRLHQPVERGLIPHAVLVAADGHDEQFEPAKLGGLKPINPLRQEAFSGAEKHQRKTFLRRAVRPAGQNAARRDFSQLQRSFTLNPDAESRLNESGKRFVTKLLQRHGVHTAPS